MYCLSDREIDFIADDIHGRGISMEDLRNNLLDHICLIIEHELPQDGNFEECYARVIKRFYTKDLREIEDATVLLLQRKHHILVTRTQFFCLLFAVFIGPYIAYDLAWMIFAGESSFWHIPIRVWGASMVFSFFPLFILLVLLLTPERFDPLIPRRSLILLGKKPFIKIIPPGSKPIHPPA